MTATHGIFMVFAVIAVVSAAAMLTRKHALDGAICLIVCFLSLAGLYAMLEAPFVAIMQVLVYAGAIMMLIIFVIMTVDAQERLQTIPKPVIVGGVVAVSIMAICMILFSVAIRAAQIQTPTASDFPPGTVERIGHLLFTGHVLNFEMISVLLLAALVGALVLGKKHQAS